MRKCRSLKVITEYLNNMFCYYHYYLSPLCRPITIIHMKQTMLLGYMVLYFSTLRSLCAAISTAVYCICLISCLPGMLLRYFLKDFDMLPVAPIIIFTFRMRSIAIVKSYFKIYSASFLIPFLSPEIAISIKRHY